MMCRAFLMEPEILLTTHYMKEFYEKKIDS